MKITDVSLAELFAATGIRSLAELQNAEKQLEQFGLIRVQRNESTATYTLLDPKTRQPLTFPNGRV
jgi:hypothetical protein